MTTSDSASPLATSPRASVVCCEMFTAFAGLATAATPETLPWACASLVSASVPASATGGAPGFIDSGGSTAAASTSYSTSMRSSASSAMASSSAATAATGCPANTTPSMASTAWARGGAFFFTDGMSARPRVGGGPRRFGDRLDHLGVARAPAEVAGNRVADVVLGRLRVLGEERGGRHQHARDAEAALRHAVTHERVLHGRERPAARQPLDGGHGAPSRLHREHEAARHELAIQMHGARAAVAGAATLLGSGEAEVLAEGVEQRDVRLHERLDGLAVDSEAQDLLGHDETSVQAVARSSAMVRVRRVRMRTR